MVKRYSLKSDVDKTWMSEDPTGAYVRFEDVFRLIEDRPKSDIPRATASAEAELRRHRDRRDDLLEGWVVVTEATHPALHHAFEAISHDNGYGAGHETYAVPPEWVAALPSAEVALDSLSKEDRDQLTIGEGLSETSPAARADPEVHALSRLLHDFWQDWDGPPGDDEETSWR